MANIPEKSRVVSLQALAEHSIVGDKRSLRGKEMPPRIEIETGDNRSGKIWSSDRSRVRCLIVRCPNE